MSVLREAWRLTWEKFCPYYLSLIAGMATADLINWIAR